MYIADEMKIKEDLVYNKHNGDLIGFTNLGETNDHFKQFECEMKGNTSQCEPLANSVVVFMVRGRITNL